MLEKRGEKKWRKAAKLSFDAGHVPGISKPRKADNGKTTILKMYLRIKKWGFYISHGSYNFLWGR